MKATIKSLFDQLFIAVLLILFFKYGLHASDAAVGGIAALSAGSLLIFFPARLTDLGRISDLAGIFDHGATETQIQNGAVSAVGAFHGRHAEISIADKVSPRYVTVSVWGDFSPQFQARPKGLNRQWLLRSSLWLALVVLGSYVADQWQKKLTAIPTFAWTFAGACAGIYLTQFFVFSRRRFGKVYFYKPAKVSVPFPGSENLEFSSGGPETFAASIERPEIREGVSRLIDSGRAELLCVAYRFRPGTGAHVTDGNTIDAYFTYQRKSVEPEHLRALLVDLLSLGNSLEAIPRRSAATELWERRA
jgi:hypothetical protein